MVVVIISAQSAPKKILVPPPHFSVVATQFLMESHYTDVVRTFKSNEQTVCHLLLSFIYVSYLLSVPYGSGAYGTRLLYS